MVNYLARRRFNWIDTVGLGFMINIHHDHGFWYAFAFGICIAVLSVIFEMNSDARS